MVLMVLHAADESATRAISNKELQHVQQLLSHYEQQESAAAAAAANSGSTTSTTSTASNSSKSAAAANTSSATTAASAAGSSSEDAVSWAGEEYEKDYLRGVERGYLKFSKRLARQPEQCAR